MHLRQGWPRITQPSLTMGKLLHAVYATHLLTKVEETEYQYQYQ